MNNNLSLHARILVALFDCSRTGRSRNVHDLAQLLGARRSSVACALNDCIEGGLISSDHLSLTFVGLSLATRLRREQAYANQVEQVDATESPVAHNDEGRAA